LALALAGENCASSVFDEVGAVARAIPVHFITHDSALSVLVTAFAQAGRFDEAVMVARDLHYKVPQDSALSALAAALAQAGRFDEAGAVARAIQDEGNRSSVLSALAAVIAQAGKERASSVFDEAWAAARSIRDDFYRACALSALAAALTRAGEEHASGVFAEAVAVARTIQTDTYRALALRDLALALAQAGRFDEAFSTLGQRQADEFLETIAPWSPAFEKVKPGLSVTILREAIHIIGWARPDWRKIHELLVQP
jgi:Flp pilus assembly protein TadD